MADPTIERFQRVLASACAALEDRRQDINDHNVFPVADGDTGDNMALTIRAVMDSLESLDGQPMDSVGRDDIVRTVADAALLGARGNSGVILSQIIRGAAEELASRPGRLVDPQLINASLSRAVAAAYGSIQSPTEGTMLTVLREMATAISHSLAHTAAAAPLEVDVPPEQQDLMLATILETAIDEGIPAVERTPEQLRVLAENGVVDAGAYGLLLILAGMVAGLRGEQAVVEQVPHWQPARVAASHHEDSRFRWCSNFVVSGQGLNAAEFRPRLEELGDSVLVVGDEHTLRVHVHTNDRSAAQALFDGTGEITQIDDADMWRQIEARDRRLRPAPGRTGVVAVAAGDGMRSLFEALGAYVVDGGPTLNPSPHELLRGIDDLGADEVLVLANSANVVLAAQQAAEMTDRVAHVVPSTSQQAGLTALVELDAELDAAGNAERLGEALVAIRAGAVAPAGRDDPKGRFKRGDAVGFIGDEIVAWGGAGSTLAMTVERISESAEIVTVIEGDGAPIPLEALPVSLPEGADLELRHGGQPHYWWLLAAQ
jgi:DAK2 domain fusion protein YloV